MGKRIANPAKVEANAQSIAAVQDGLAYIVGNTNTTGSTLAVGQFVYVKGHSTIDEGLRKVTASISANADITTNNTSACSEGGLNALNSNINTLNTKILKHIDITDTNPINITRKALAQGIAINKDNFVSAVCQDNVVICLPFYNATYSAMYIKIVDTSLTDATGNKNIRIYYY